MREQETENKRKLESENARARECEKSSESKQEYTKVCLRVKKQEERACEGKHKCEVMHEQVSTSKKASMCKRKQEKQKSKESKCDLARE